MKKIFDIPDQVAKFCYDSSCPPEPCKECIQNHTGMEVVIEHAFKSIFDGGKLLATEEQMLEYLLRNP